MISEVIPRDDYDGQNSTGPFVGNFKIDDESEVEVLIGGVTKTLNVHYTVDGVGDDTFSVTADQVVPAGTKVSLLRSQPIAQSSSYTLNEATPSPRIGADFDRCVKIIQMVSEKLRRVPMLAKASLLRNIILPDGQVGYYLRWKSTTELENVTTIITTPGAITLPLSIANGGTGAITQVSALMSLGAAALVHSHPLSDVTGGLGTFAPYPKASVVNSTTLRVSSGACPIKAGPSGDWFIQILNASGRTITNAGLAASTIYYIYLYYDVGSENTTIELSTTGHSLKDTTALETKTGDETRVLIGMLRTNASSEFVDSGSQLFLVNWGDRKLKTRSNYLAANKTSTASASFQEADNTKRLEFLCWNDEDVEVSGNLSYNTSGTSVTAQVALTVDGVTPGTRSRDLWASLGVTSGALHFAAIYKTRLAEGYHYVTPAFAGDGSAGTATLFGGTIGNLGTTSYDVSARG